jgi:membrane protease YdiL (CAAX protease family)
MLPFPFWRSDAVVRLIVSIFICLYAGSVIGVAAHGVVSGKAGFGLLGVVIAALVCLVMALVLVRRPFTGDRPLRPVLIAMVCFYGGMLLGAWAHKLAGPAQHSVLQMVTSALGFQGATIVLVILFTREHGLHWREAFGLDIARNQAVLYGLSFAGLFLPLAWVLQRVSVEILHLIPGIDPKEQDAVQTLRMAGNWDQRVILAVVTIAFAPVAEELLFRGVLYRWIRQFGFPKLALWVTSLLFSAVHFNVATFVPLAVFSLGLTLLYQRQGNLLAPITAHACFNALNFSLLYMMEIMDKAGSIR